MKANCSPMPDHGGGNMFLLQRIVVSCLQQGSPPSFVDGITMEELQASIQAAIARCKNYIAKDDKLNYLPIS
jgi:hypothetical protein